jgi:hypothetical protein
MEGVTLDFGDISGFSIPNNSGTKIVKIKILNLGRPDLDFHSSLPDSFAKTASPIVSPLRSILLIVKSVQYTYLFFSLQSGLVLLVFLQGMKMDIIIKGEIGVGDTGRRIEGIG